MARLGAIRNIGIGVVAKGWLQVIALVLALLAARILGKQEFGIYAIANVFIMLLQGMMYSGVYDYIIKTRSADLEADTCFWMNFGFGACGAAIVAVLAPIASRLTHSPAVMELMLALAPSALIASSSSWQEALLLREGRLRAYYGLCIGVESVACAVGIASLLGGLGVWSFVVYRYAQVSLAALGYFAVLRRRPKFAWHAEAARTVFAFSGNLYVARIVSTISAYSADLLIGALVNPATAGAYRLGSRVVLGVSEIAYQPVFTVAWVHFSRAAHDDEALRQEWLSFITVLSLTAWPALAGLALLSRSIVHLVVGSGWDEAIPVIVVLAAARILAMFDVFLDPLLGIRDRSRLVLKFRGAASLLTVAVLAVLARYGASGAAAGQALVAVFLASCSIHIGLQTTKASPAGLLRTLVPGIIGTLLTAAAAACAGLVPVLCATPLRHLASATAAGVATWGAVLFVLYRRHVFSLTMAARGSALP